MRGRHGIGGPDALHRRAPPGSLALIRVPRTLPLPLVAAALIEGLLERQFEVGRVVRLSEVQELSPKDAATIQALAEDVRRCYGQPRVCRR